MKAFGESGSTTEISMLDVDARADTVSMLKTAKAIAEVVSMQSQQGGWIGAVAQGDQ